MTWKEYYSLKRETLRSKCRERNRMAYQQNPAKFTERSRNHYKAHSADWKARIKKWQARNKDKVRDYKRKWWLKNKWRYCGYAVTRKALKKKSAINLRHIQKYVRSVRLKTACRCYYCSAPISGKDAHFDHIVPLSRGGPHSVENLCVSCSACNHSKFTKLISEWQHLGQQHFNL